MTGTKKHSPMQSETGSIVEQAAEAGKMEELIRGLVELAEKKQALSIAEGSTVDPVDLVRSPADLPTLDPSDRK